MKELERIILTINSFLKPFDLTCCIGGDFCYYYLDDEVQVSFLSAERDEEEFMRSIQIQNPLCCMDVFLWSLLHEIGHSQTIDEISDEDWGRSNRTKELCRDGKISRWEYYCCVDEVMATQWAVEFANENQNALFSFWNELQPLIMDFYRVCGQPD